MMQIPTDRYDLLTWLEGRWIPVFYHKNISGEIFCDERWQKVENGAIYGQYALINLHLHNTESLERLARQSMSQAEYERWYCDQQIAYQAVADGKSR